MSEPVRTIAVVGGGVAGWCAAAAFAQRLPGVRVTVVEDAHAPPQLCDLFGAALPTASEFHADLRLDEAKVVAASGGLFRLGTRFEGWSSAGGYIHAYGEFGQATGAAAFHHLWLLHEEGAFGDTNSAATLAAAGRFATGDTHQHGLTLDPTRYTALMRAHALAAGVTAIAGHAQPMVRNGRVALRVDGVGIDADVIADTRGHIADALAPTWELWSRWLPCNRAALTYTAAPTGNPPLTDTARAGAAGWTLTAPARAATLSATIAADGFGTIGFTQGRRITPWTGNVVAVGEAAVVVEPLEGGNLHVVHAHIDRVIASLPARDMQPVELADYNRQTADEANRLRDFLALHYHAQDRPEPFWRDLAATAPPDSLARDLMLFRERGRFPVHDGETFARDSWLAVLIGQGVRPRRADPLAINALTASQRAAAVAGARATAATAARAASTHAQVLESLPA